MTVTTQVAVAVPHLAVIVAVPAETAVTLPLETVATLLLEVDQVTVPLAVAVRVELLPATNESVDLFNVTESLLVAAVTVTVHFALAVPHFAVMVAVPAAMAVTLPLLTVATEELLVDQVTVPLAVAVKVEEFPTVNAKVDLERVTESVVVELPLDEPTVKVTEPI